MTVDSGSSVGSTPAEHSRPERAEDTLAATSEGARSGRWRRARLRWRRWRRSRPFWGALFVILGAAEILGSVRAPLPVVLHVGPQGMAGYLLPLVMLLCGLLLLFHPEQRMFYSIVSIVLALASWLTSNLGGFFIGLLLGVLGGSLAFAWTRAGPVSSTSGPSGR
ncbi:DUF6114 domain-containing protein [Micromonospora sp. NPDC049679]|uniref:DUF6114 domain-containing protein n=1 Tax=Micromonospora sp. NPDC049679 TaxID=3155920 RepID=UPI003407E538